MLTNLYFFLQSFEKSKWKCRWFWKATVPGSHQSAGQKRVGKRTANPRRNKKNERYLRRQDCWVRSPKVCFDSILSSQWFGILLPKLFWPTVRKKCSRIFLKFEAEGKEFAKFLRSLEQLIQTLKGKNKFLVTGCFLNLFLEVFQVW